MQDIAELISLMIQAVYQSASGGIVSGNGDGLSLSATQGNSINAATRFINWYWDQLMELGVDRVPVHRTFLEVLHLLKPSIALFHPSILGQVLLRGLNQRWRQFGQHHPTR